MAYALSNDPRATLLREPFEAYRRRFHEWRRGNAQVLLEQALRASPEPG